MQSATVDGQRGRCSARPAKTSDLDGAWPLLAVLLGLPRVLRDVVYDRVARRRYRWFGRTEACLVPGPDLAARFVD